MHWEMLPYDNFSSDLAPVVFSLVLWKSTLKGKHLDLNVSLQNVVLLWLLQQPSSFYAKGIRNLSQRWYRSVDPQGKYFQKLAQFGSVMSIHNDFNKEERFRSILSNLYKNINHLSIINFVNNGQMIYILTIFIKKNWQWSFQLKGKRIINISK